MTGPLGLVLALMLVDFIDRQILVSMYPLLKREWNLSDAELGALATVVALAIGAGAIPISLAVARFNRTRVLGIMAMIWSVATLAGAVVTGYGQLLATRLLIGCGQAGYAPIAGSLLADTFPPHRRSTVLGTLLSMAVFGSILGVFLGGQLAGRYGWRAGMAIAGGVSLLLAIVLYLAHGGDAQVKSPLPALDARSGDRGSGHRAVLASPTMVLSYAGFAVLSLVGGAIVAWLPSHFERGLQLPVQTAAGMAALVLASSGLGTLAIACSTDRIGALEAKRRLAVAAMTGFSSCALLTLAFGLDPGRWQYAILLVAGFFLLGHMGPVLALVTTLCGPELRSVSIAILVAVQNLVGLATGPLLAGMLSDRLGLPAALQCLSALGLLAAVLFLVAAHIAGRAGARNGADVAQGAIS